jgi:hypothetical protein
MVFLAGFRIFSSYRKRDVWTSDYGRIRVALVGWVVQVRVPTHWSPMTLKESFDQVVYLQDKHNRHRRYLAQQWWTFAFSSVGTRHSLILTGYLPDRYPSFALLRQTFIEFHHVLPLSHSSFLCCYSCNHSAASWPLCKLEFIASSTHTPSDHVHNLLDVSSSSKTESSSVWLGCFFAKIGA